eukprot:2528837-Rhodomonas_salina.3
MLRSRREMLEDVQSEAAVFDSERQLFREPERKTGRVRCNTGQGNVMLGAWNSMHGIDGDARGSSG